MPDSNSAPAVMATPSPGSAAAPTPSPAGAPVEADLAPLASPSPAPTPEDTGPLFVLQVKYGGATHEIRLRSGDSVGTLKQSLAGVTLVPPERQKLLGLVRGQLPHDTTHIHELSFLRAKPDLVAADPNDASGARQVEATVVLGITLLGQAPAPAVSAPPTTSDPPTASVFGPGSKAAETYESVILAGRMARNEDKAAKMYMEVQRRLDDVCERTTDFAILHPPRPGKRLLVLDLDYTLVDTEALMRGETTSAMRPYLTNMLANLYPYFDICVWSHTHWRWLEAKLTELHLLSDPRFQISFVLDRTAMPNVRIPGPWPPPERLMAKYRALKRFDRRTACGEAKAIRTKLFNFLRDSVPDSSHVTGSPATTQTREKMSHFGSLYDRLVFLALHKVHLTYHQNLPDRPHPDSSIEQALSKAEADTRRVFATFWDAVQSCDPPASPSDGPLASHDKTQFVDGAMSLHHSLVRVLSAAADEKYRTKAAPTESSVPVNPAQADSSAKRTTTPSQSATPSGSSLGGSSGMNSAHRAGTGGLVDSGRSRSTIPPCPRTDTPDARATKRQRQCEGDPSSARPHAPAAALAAVSPTISPTSWTGSSLNHSAQEGDKPVHPPQLDQSVSTRLLLQNLDKLADAFEHAVQAGQVVPPPHGPHNPPPPAETSGNVAMDVDVPAEEGAAPSGVSDSADNSEPISPDGPEAPKADVASASSTATPSQRPSLTAEALGLAHGLPRVVIPTALLQGEQRGRERAPREQREGTAGPPDRAEGGSSAGPGSAGEAPAPSLAAPASRRPQLTTPSSGGSRNGPSPSRGRSVRSARPAAATTSGPAAAGPDPVGPKAKRPGRSGSPESSHVKKMAVKPLELIWRRFGREQYSERNTIHVDDIARNFALNPRNGVLVRGYHHAPHFDTELIALERYCLQLAHPSVEDISALDHTHWRAYRGPSAGQEGREEERPGRG